MADTHGGRARSNVGGRGGRVLAVAGLLLLIAMSGCSANRDTSATATASSADSSSQNAQAGQGGSATSGASGASGSSGSSGALAAPNTPSAKGAPGAVDATGTGETANGSTAAQGASFNADAYDAAPLPAIGSFISTATMTVRVDNVADVKPKVIATARAVGGDLFGEQTTLGASSTSVITLKVPPEKFATLLVDLGKLGALEAEEVKTDDVTQQVVDLGARITAASSSLDRTRALLDQAKSLSEISQLENEVARRQADLESLKGQQATLQGKIQLSTIVITLSGKDATPAIQQQNDDKDKVVAAPLPGFFDGLSGGLGIGAKVGSVALAAIGAVLPFLPFAILAYLAVRIVRRQQRRRLPSVPAAAE